MSSPLAFRPELASSKSLPIRLARGSFACLQEALQIGVRDPPSPANVDGAQLSGFDPLPHSCLCHLKTVGKLLHSLVPIVWHLTHRGTLCREFSIFVTYS